MNLLLATRNRHKLEEIRTILDLPADALRSALDFPDLPDVEEDGPTFEANAIKKAVTLAQQTGCWTLADDSGLEVDALGGAPGVYSARYAGEPADYQANNEKLLRELDGRSDRRARFRCVVALSDPSGLARTVEGVCEGTITLAARGVEGFGYDPLFVPDGADCTFAELPAEEKHRLSHRGRALQQARSAWGAELDRLLKPLTGAPSVAWTADRLLELARGFQAPCVLAAAVDLDVFGLLADKPLTAEQAASRRGVDRRGLVMLLDALTALRLLQKTDETYRVPEELVPLLASNAPGSVRAMARHMANCLRRWTELPWIVERGASAPDRPSLLGADEDRASFIEAMDNVSRPVADGLIASLGLRDVRCVLDVGGASGTWTLAWLRAVPGSRAILFDLPPVIPMARARLEHEGMADRVAFVAGDYNQDAMPEGADLAWISAIIHQNSPEENRALYRRVAAALPPGGRVLLRDLVMEEGHIAPVAGALFAVNMLVGTPRGGTYTLSEIREDLESAGFHEVYLLHADPGMHNVVSAVRR